MSDARFREQLRRQLGFIQRSCEAFDQGFTEEAVRIATSVRVLLRQTRHSTSLLTHLGAQHIRLLSTAPATPLVPGSRITFLNSLVIMRLSAAGAVLLAPQDDSPFRKAVSVSEWLEQVVWILDGRGITRSDLVLGAANNDGGAHVDATLAVEYAELAREGAIGIVINGLTGDSQPVRDAHLVSLRQIGYEILNSEELVSLLKGPRS